MMTGYGAALDAVTPVLPGSRRAPGALGLVQSFLDSVDLETGTDDLATPDDAARWLRDHGLLADDESVAVGDRARLVAARERIRDIIEARDDPGGAIRPATELPAAPVVLVMDASGGVHLQPAGGGVDGALARILAAIVAASAEGTWTRLRICRNDGCRWAFYDASRNRSAHWCSMAVCGNRMKGRAFRQRRGTARLAPAGPL